MATYDLTTSQLQDIISSSAPPEVAAATLAALGTHGVVTPGQTVSVEGGAAGAGTNFFTLDPGSIFLAGGDSTGRTDVVDTGTAGTYLNAGSPDFYTLLATGTGADTLQGGSGQFQTLIGQQGDTVITGTGLHQTARLDGGATGYVTDGQEGWITAGSNTLYGGLNEGDSTTLASLYGSHNNLIQVSHGDNTLISMSGSDTLIGGTGNDVLYGGATSAASDYLIVGTGGGTAIVGQGNNVLQSSGGEDSLYAGAGNDTLYGGGQSYLFAGTGGTDVYAKSGDTVFSGSGDDLLKVSGPGAASFYLSSADSGGGNDTVFGGDGADQFLVGTNGNDTIYGGGGGDTLSFYDYTEDQATVTQNGDGSTLYQFGSGETQQSVLVYDVQNIVFKGTSSS